MQDADKLFHSMKAAIRGWDDDPQVIEFLRRLDKELWKFMDEEVVPASMEDEATLGPCGCTDYHMADCPLITG